MIFFFSSSASLDLWWKILFAFNVLPHGVGTFPGWVQIPRYLMALPCKAPEPTGCWIPTSSHWTTAVSLMVRKSICLSHGPITQPPVNGGVNEWIHGWTVSWVTLKEWECLENWGAPKGHTGTYTGTQVLFWWWLLQTHEASKDHKTLVPVTGGKVTRIDKNQQQSQVWRFNGGMEP